jgi:glutamyl-tRNA synthetase
MAVRVRFAPSPTGDLHAGGAMVAVANWLLRLGAGGAFILRIDDTDASRTVPGAEARIRDDLAWLGIVPDEGPDAGPVGPYRQSERREQHLEAAEELIARGAARRDGDGAIVLPASEEAVVIEDRSRGAIRIPPGEVPPSVLVRSDGRPTYLLATAVDDIAMGITHVLRGEDHIANSARQILISRALGAEAPALAHLPIMVGEDGARLSGRGGAIGIGGLRAEGWIAETLVDALARAACPPVTALPPSPADGLAATFSVEHLGHGTTRLDPDLLHSLGRAHLALLSGEERCRRVAAWLAATAGRTLDATIIGPLCAGIDGAATLPEAAHQVLAVVDAPPDPPTGEAERAAAAALLASRATGPERLDSAEAEQLLGRLEVSKRAIRRVLTGADQGIPLPFVLAALPQAEVLARAEAVLARP